MLNLQHIWMTDTDICPDTTKKLGTSEILFVKNYQKFPEQFSLILNR